MLKKFILGLLIVTANAYLNIKDDFTCPESDIAKGCWGPNDCLYSNPEDCNTFIQCIINPDGTSTPFINPCPEGLQWNDNIKGCHWPSESTCGQQTNGNEGQRDITTEEPEFPTDKTFEYEYITDFTCPESDIAKGCMGVKDCLYKHPTNCNQFIHCEIDHDGKTIRPTVYDCPLGLLWNDNKKECDWPANSTCRRLL